MKTLKPLIKSQNDTLLYKPIKLANQLTCLLIQDKDTNKSCAVMKVNSGAFNDPKTHQGLAHFLEHMLFMGSKKYPQNGYYREFVRRNGGSCNAYTDTGNTVYYFSVKNKALLEALDIFANFFISPLLDPIHTQKEINAVHSEHMKNLNNDNWREQHLRRSLARKETPSNHFSTGCLETLDKPDIIERLKEYHNTYYSSNIMNLVVYSNEDLDEMAERVKKIFTPIVDKGVKPFDYARNGLPYQDSNVKKVLRIKRLKQEKILKFHWYLPSMHEHYRSNPLKLISHLIGHESEGSILSLLVEKHLATALSCGPRNVEDFFTSFAITIRLTDKGFDNYKEVVGIVGEYINMLKRKGLEKWIFEEIQTINSFRFNYSIKANQLSKSMTLAETIGSFPIENALNCGFLMEEYKPELFQEILSQLNADSLVMTLTSPDYINLQHKEPIYGTEYSFDDLPDEIANQFTNPSLSLEDSKKITLPPQNYFIPKNFEIKPGNTVKHPEKIINDENGQLFFKQDTLYNLPKIRVVYKIYTAIKGQEANPHIHLYKDIWKIILTKDLKEYRYLASMAKINLSFVISYKGFTIDVNGFNDGMQYFIENLAKRIRAFIEMTDDVNKREYLKEQFEVAKASRRDALARSVKRPMYKSVMAKRGYLLINNTLSDQVLLDNIDDTTFEEYIEFHKQCLIKFCYEGLIMGNCLKNEAIELNNALINNLKTKSYKTLSVFDIMELRPLEFPSKQKTVLIEQYPIADEKNDCVYMIFQYRQNPEDVFVFELLSNYLKTTFFHDLRTQQQLGYIVMSMKNCLKGVNYIEFVIQSDKLTAQECAGKVYQFLEKHKQLIREMSPSKIKNSIIEGYKQKWNNLIEESSFYFNKIIKHTYEFDYKETAPVKVSKLTKEDLITVYDRLFFKDRKVLEVHCVNSNSLAKNQEILELRKELQENNEKLVIIDSIKQFKRMTGQYPDIQAPGYNK